MTRLDDAMSGYDAGFEATVYGRELGDPPQTASWIDR